MFLHNSPILAIEILLIGPDSNTFIAITKTLTSLSTAGKSISARVTATLTDPFVIFSP